MIELTKKEISNLDCPVCGSSLIFTDFQSPDLTVHLFKCSDEHRYGCSITVKMSHIRIKEE